MDFKKLLGKKFHNKAGYKIWVTYDDCYDSYHVHADQKDMPILPAWGVYSGFNCDHVVDHCVEYFDDYVKAIKDKIARRYFLKLVRELPMHDLKIKDFIDRSGVKIDWEKVKEYQNKYEDG